MGLKDMYTYRWIWSDYGEVRNQDRMGMRETKGEKAWRDQKGMEVVIHYPGHTSSGKIKYSWGGDPLGTVGLNGVSRGWPKGWPTGGR